MCLTKDSIRTFPKSGHLSENILLELPIGPTSTCQATGVAIQDKFVLQKHNHISGALPASGLCSRLTSRGAPMGFLIHHLIPHARFGIGTKPVFLMPVKTGGIFSAVSVHRPEPFALTLSPRFMPGFCDKLQRKKADIIWASPYTSAHETWGMTQPQSWQLSLAMLPQSRTRLNTHLDTDHSRYR